MLNENAYLSIREEAESAGATLVAVTKQRPISVIQSLYDLGQRDFGENRVTELTQKQADLPDDIRWHFIGHLQRNKVKYIAPFIHLIHSGDSPRLLRAINAEAVKVARTIPVLLQYRIANEESKYGLDPEAPTAIFEGLGLRDVANIRIDGVMGMATYTDDEEQVSNEFGRLAAIFRQLKQREFADQPTFREISMGMSGDYKIALRQASTLLRVGSLLYH